MLPLRNRSHGRPRELTRLGNRRRTAGLKESSVTDTDPFSQCLAGSEKPCVNVMSVCATVSVRIRGPTKRNFAYLW